jgi:hypothetical protein
MAVGSSTSKFQRVLVQLLQTLTHRLLLDTCIITRRKKESTSGLLLGLYPPKFGLQIVTI